MTIIALETLTSRSVLHHPLTPEQAYELNLKHHVAVHSNDVTVGWQADLLSDHGVACEFQATHRVTFDEPGAHAWVALETTWPYFRQQAEAFLSGHGLAQLLPVSIPLSPPETVQVTSAPESSEALPVTGAQTLPVRPLPLTGRLATTFSLQRKLQQIVQGERQWLLSAVQLYAALLSTSRSRSAGTRLEWHSRNTGLQQDFFERLTTVSSSDFLNLPLEERRVILATVRQTVTALFNDVFTWHSDVTTGELADSYQDDVELMLDPPETLEGEVSEPTPEQEELSRYVASLYEFVVAPLAELDEKKSPLTDVDLPLLNGEPMRMLQAVTSRDGPRLDILALTMVITDAGHLFEAPDPLTINSPLSEPTKYRLRYLHADHSQEPHLRFLLDLNLDADVAELLDERLAAELAEAHLDPQLERWRHANALKKQPWPRSGETLLPCELDWSPTDDLESLQSWLQTESAGHLTSQQWHEAIRVKGLNLSLILRSWPLPPDVLSELAEHPDEDVRCEVAEQPNLPEMLLEQLWNDSDEVRLGLANNPALPEGFQRRLAHVDSHLVRAQLACNPTVLPDLLTVLADDPLYPIRGNVACNPSTPLAALQFLAQDEHDWVREEAQVALQRRQGKERTQS